MNRRVLCAMLLATLWMAGCSTAQPRGVLYQTSTLDALLEGAYAGEVSLGQLKSRGDTGIGTFNELDGEMILLDGTAYQVRADGKVYRPGDSMLTPLATVTFFQPSAWDAPQDANLSFAQLSPLWDKSLATQNVPVMIKITGRFDYAKTRSVPRQSRPFPRLTEVVKTQPTFEFHDVQGTIVAVRFPAYFNGINMAGWHAHFITAARDGGGHLLDCRIRQGAYEIQYLPSLRLDIPGGDFRRLDLRAQNASELQKVEK